MRACRLIAAVCATGALLCWWAPGYLGTDPAETAAWRLGSELFSVAGLAIVVVSALIGRLEEKEGARR